MVGKDRGLAPLIVSSGASSMVLFCVGLYLVMTQADWVVLIGSLVLAGLVATMAVLGRKAKRDRSPPAP
jgi:purine-cytosine permease-like protein